MKFQGRSGQVVAELLRLGVVLLLTAGGYLVAELLPDVFALDQEALRLIGAVLGALLGYLLGGMVGRAVVRGVDTATHQLARVPAAQLVAAAIGAGAGALLGVVLLLPVVLLPFQQYTVPVALLVIVALAYAGGRIGGSRGAELGRFVGVRGRLEVRTPSRGGGVKVVDTSALVDGRILDVARAGFLEGTLVVPTFVLDELQVLADAETDHRRHAGRRGLSSLQSLQDDGLVAVEITDDDVESADTVDAKLAALAEQRGAALVTGDAELAQVAELRGVRVLNPHALADAVRSPVLPGERLEVQVVRAGREPGQGIAYTQDGTMLVIEDAAELIGASIEVDVTSIVQSRRGRLLFAAPVAEVEPT